MHRPIIASGVFTLALCLAGAAGAQPQDQSPQGQRSDVRQACAADLQKLCPDARPGPGGGMRECVTSHYAALSDACKAAIAQMRSHRQGGGPAPGGQ